MAVAITVLTAVLASFVVVPASSGASVAPRTSLVTGEIGSVSCQPGQCVAAGAGRRTANAPKVRQAWPLAHGNWSVVTLPNGASTRQSPPSLSCPQLDTCVGVGATEVGAVYKGFAERLDAGVWLEVPLPSGTPGLSSVSCVSTTWCTAVGGTTEDPYAGVALQWNGTTWSRVETAPVASPWGLAAVSCLSSNFCMAVGYSESTPLAEEWNGTAWSVTTPPAKTVPESWQHFDSISCTNASFCLAVGWEYGCCGSLGSIALAWDGSSWTSVTMSTALGEAVLSGVSCTSATSCLAVGGVSPADLQKFHPYAVAARWDGTALTTVAGAAVGPQSVLGAVSCTRANWCAAVGTFTRRTGGPQPLVERWNGATLNRMWAPG